MTDELTRLETARFMLDMKDHWNREDFLADTRMWRRITELRKAAQAAEQNNRDPKGE